MEALAEFWSAWAPEAGTLVLACLAVAAAGVLRGLTGFGFALAAVPLLSMFLAPAASVALVICLQAMVGFRDLVQVGRLVDWASVSRLSVGSLVGTPVGVALLAWLDPAAMRLAIAALVGLGLAMLLRPGKVPVPAEPSAGAPRGALPTGLASGVFGGLAAMAGPPAIVWYMRAGHRPAVMRASLMVFFFIGSVFAAPMMAWNGVLGASTVALAVCALPVLILSTSAGARLFARTTDAGYRKVALGVLAAMAAASAVRGAMDLLGG
ncbi:sulfite exporter TauE/SafE family protein [Albimonas sp. CAU 1670]|uniref:sulfite exporter TauE/SafE family protein n=1 Tax=Albimonas sp. CAU 1670 TaxID=3032599 RepID=UPI0023DA3894|nr:sulfite exporter TauE/SafE family protein [Albimonas sp. CAU 1670]MDF2233696.1 sulfite exporter TauE/SafE family protein [Albimonas sp. CAU 1670]